MNNIKTYRDGARFMLVVENCVGETAKKVNAFILELMGAIEPEQIPGIIPEKPVDEPPPSVARMEEITPNDPEPFKVPIPEEDAKNLPVDGPSGTLGRAIDAKDTEAIIAVCLRAKTMDESVRDTAMKLCKEYILNDCQKRIPENTLSNEIRKFFRIYKPLIEGATTQILESAGYASTEDFFDFADEYLHQQAYASVLESVIERVRI